MSQSITFSNFRDLGGLELPDGGMLRHGKLYRTSRLYPRNAADRRLLDRMKLDCVIDLRTPQEVREKPDKLPKEVEYVNASVFGNTEFEVLAPTRSSQLAMLRCTDEQYEEIMNGIRKSYEFMPYASDAYGQLFKRMNEGKTIAFHCTAGKDRTGVAAMMTELALGRTKEQAREQYLLSNVARAERTEKLMKFLRLLPLKEKFYECALYSSRVHNELFEAAYGAIFSKYASIDEFLADVYGITQQNLSDWKKYYTVK